MTHNSQSEAPVKMGGNQLPAPVLYELFRFFNVSERAALEETCRQWKCVVKFINDLTTSLCIHWNAYPFEKRWSFTNRLVGYWNSIQAHSFLLALQQPNLVRLENIRRLCLVGHQSERVLKAIPERFTGLQHLETDSIFDLQDLFKSELPKLKVLALRNFSTSHQFTINTPSLEMLAWYPAAWSSAGDKFISFVRSMELKHIECNSYPLIGLHANIRLECLETLNCKRLREPISLYELPALKQLQVCERVDSALEKNLNSQRFQLGSRCNLVFLDLYHCSFTNPLSYSSASYYFVRAKKIRKKLNELSKSSLSISHRLCLYYNGFPDLFDDDQTKALLQKFNSVYKVDVFDKQDPKRLIEFLRQCGDFKVLDLYYTAFDQSFYDEIGQFASIIHLQIKEQTNWRIVSYDFLQAFPHLRTIFVHYDGLSFGIEHIFAFLKAAFENCVSLMQFGFGRKYFKCVVQKSTHTDGFILYVGPGTQSGPPPHYPDIDQLLAALSATKPQLNKGVLIPINL